MSFDLMLQKAVELQNAGAMGAAEEIYLKLLQAMPENSDVWNLLGLIAQTRRDFKRAEDCFLAAIKYAPAPFFMHFFNLGLNYKFLNKPKEAMEALGRAVELNPGFKEGWNFLGLAKCAAGDIENGAKCFCKALELDVDFEEARANLCFYTKDFETLFKIADEERLCYKANFLAGIASEGIERKVYYLERAVAAEPDNTEGLCALAKALRLGGDINKALTYYHKALNLYDNDVCALLGAADIYLEFGELDKAETYYKKSFEVEKDDAGAHLNYGILLYRQKRFSEALEEYRKAAVATPEKSEVSYNLALILKELGDYEEALGLMFNAHLKQKDVEIYAINIMETLEEFYKINAEAALKIALNWQKTAPQNVFSNRLLAQMTGGKDEISDVKYAKVLFDAFAASYDETMGKLESKIISTFKEIHGDIKGHALELGCGTGMGGAALKGEKNRFDGVDVSANMLEIAKKRGCYEALFNDDIVSFLEKNRGCAKYDIVLMFDVLCYIGDLADVFAKMFAAEAWFSIEKAEEERSGAYYLGAGGRYKHKQSYVEEVLAKAGFEVKKAVSLILRKEGEEEVPGILYCVKPRGKNGAEWRNGCGFRVLSKADPRNDGKKKS